MYTPSDLKKGVAIQYEGAPHLVETVKVSAPTARGAATITRVRLRNMITRQKVDVSFRGSETFPEADYERRPCQLLYEQQGTFHFMDTETFEQFAIARSELDWEVQFLKDEQDGLFALKTGERIFGLELPNQVVLEVKETAPSIKGATAAARTKPATLETGLVVQVPEHISVGDLLRVDTRTGDFLGRA